MYLETMERLFAGTQKIILDAGAPSGVVPYLPLNELTRPQAPAQTPPAAAGGTR
jgi:membrane protease subunit HflK